jgi:hypothetical protein
MYIRVLTDISKPAASNGVASLMATSRIEVPKSSPSLLSYGAKVNETLDMRAIVILFIAQKGCYGVLGTHLSHVACL